MANRIGGKFATWVPTLALQAAARKKAGRLDHRPAQTV